MKKMIRKNKIKGIRKKLVKQAKGITLISLVITIIILLILAGVTLSLTLGDRGIITQAQKAKEAQEIAAIKEDMQLAILDKELEKGGTGLTKEELEEIAGNYGELQEDGNTIKTDEGYEIKIDEIYNQGGGTTGGDAATDEELAELQQKVEELEKTVEDLNNTKTELEGTIEDLNNQIEQEQGNSAALQEQVDNLTQQVDNLNKTKEQLESTISDLNTQIAELQKKQSTGTAVASDVLSGKTFSNSSEVGLTGTMASYTSGSTAITTSGRWGFDTTYGPWVYIPANGYYATAHWLNIPWATIKGSLGDAAAGNVLSGKTFTSTNGVKITGSMTNRGAVSKSLNAGGSYTIPAGYHNGSGKVTANSLSSQTSATAAAGNILSGKTAWVNGSKVTGTMTNRGAWSSTPTGSGSVTIPAGYHNGSGKVNTSTVYNNGYNAGYSAAETAIQKYKIKTGYVTSHTWGQNYVEIGNVGFTPRLVFAQCNNGDILIYSADLNRFSTPDGQGDGTNGWTITSSNIVLKGKLYNYQYNYVVVGY